MLLVDHVYQLAWDIFPWKMVANELSLQVLQWMGHSLQPSVSLAFSPAIENLSFKLAY